MSAALVISDTHFGAWTGRDLLREEFFLERLAPALEGVDGRPPQVFRRLLLALLPRVAR